MEASKSPIDNSTALKFINNYKKAVNDEVDANFQLIALSVIDLVKDKQNLAEDEIKNIREHLTKLCVNVLGEERYGYLYIHFFP